MKETLTFKLYLATKMPNCILNIIFIIYNSNNIYFIGNIHIRTTLRELLNSKQPMSVILKSSEFKTLSSFCEEEIAR